MFERTDPWGKGTSYSGLYKEALPIRGNVFAGAEYVKG